MKSAPECRSNAAVCRSLARQLGEEQRRLALRMAEIWEQLAHDSEGSTLHKEPVRAAGMLKATYDPVAQGPVPDKFLDLLKHLEAAERRTSRPIPSMRKPH
jgi:hypothetical protein